MTPWVSSAGVVRLLAWTNGLRLVVEADQVGEGAADINRNEDHATAPTLIALVFRRWSWWVNCA